MDYSLVSTPTLTTHDCLVIGINDSILPEFALRIDKQHNGLLTRLVSKLKKNGDMSWQADIDGQSLALIHCGNQTSFTEEVLMKRMAEVTNCLLKERIGSAMICMPQLNEHSADWQLQQMVLSIETHRYQMLDFKTKDFPPHQLNSVAFYLPEANQQTLQISETIADCMHFTRRLANLPANVCTPTFLAQQALQLAKEQTQLEVKVLALDELKELGMETLLAVASGSEEPPRLIEIQYQGAGNAAPVVLVGKGITFDSGGLSLKPADAMVEMKYDMTGAATVLGTIRACALLKLPINVVALMACAENMPSGTAMRPGDIVTSMSGQTVEIINTDAEGRLVLADALTYAERFNPKFVIDVATLTGAVIVALGNIYTGLMTNDEDLAQLILQAAKDSGDKAWRLPLSKEYQDALDSPLADMLNATFDRTAGSITAACFLSRFTEKYRWAHLDIAGTGWASGKKRNATGRPLPLLIQLLRHVANSR